MARALSTCEPPRPAKPRHSRSSSSRQSPGCRLRPAAPRRAVKTACRSRSARPATAVAHRSKKAFWRANPFLDSFEPDLLRRLATMRTGRSRVKSTNGGSFLQSRMYRSGVRCSDCHDPHSAKLYAPGNALCVRATSPSASTWQLIRITLLARRRCASIATCRPATFMQIDERATTRFAFRAPITA